MSEDKKNNVSIDVNPEKMSVRTVLLLLLVVAMVFTGLWTANINIDADVETEVVTPAPIVMEHVPDVADVQEGYEVFTIED